MKTRYETVYFEELDKFNWVIRYTQNGIIVGAIKYYESKFGVVFDSGVVVFAEHHLEVADFLDQLNKGATMNETEKLLRRARIIIDRYNYLSKPREDEYHNEYHNICAMGFKLNSDIFEHFHKIGEADYLKLDEDEYFKEQSDENK